jgi:hypothetical protein
VWSYEFKMLPRSIKTSGKLEKINSITVVKDAYSQDIRLAATELCYALKELCGFEVKESAAPVKNSFNIIVGNGKLVKAAGITEAMIPQEGFVMLRKGNNLYIAGTVGALFGAYDFLERFGNVRYYFPGKYGTLIPKGKGLFLPQEIRIVDRPDYPYRHLVLGRGKWYENRKEYEGGAGIGIAPVTLQNRRWRDGRVLYPLIHSLNQLGMTRRFAKTNPEYFALMPSGKRYNTPELVHTEHFCYSSKFSDVVKQDAIAFFENKGAASRDIRINGGKHGWSWTLAGNFRTGKIFGVMPGDYIYWCCCKDCAKIAPGERAYTKDPKAVRAIGNKIWSFAADMAKMVKDRGYNGGIAMMAYNPYKNVPDIDLPDNLLVQLALTGGTANPQEMKKNDQFLNDWCKKLKGKVFVWTYPGKHMRKAIPGIPAMAHNRVGHWYKDRSDRINGALFECESDQWIFAYLNCYIFLRVSWDNSIDVKAVLKEHFDRMFGKGSAEMQKVYDELERLWCDKVVGETMDSPIGPLTRIPIDIELWNVIYSPKKLAQLEKLVDTAAKKCGKDKEAAERCRFMGKQLLGSLKEAAQQFRRNQESVQDWSCRLNEKIHLRPYHIDYNEVGTVVTARETSDAFIFRFECEEPFMNKVKADYTPKGSWDLFRDSVVEVFINPTGNRRDYLHFIANSKGHLNTRRCVFNVDMPKCIGTVPGVTASAGKFAKGWYAEFTVPKKVLGNYNKKGFPVNFARNRVLNGMSEGKEFKENFYHWGPTPGRAFHQVERFGTLELGKAPETIVQDGDFTENTIVRNYILGPWIVWRSQKKSMQNQPVELDNRIFITGGRSVHMKSTGGKMSLQQIARNLKPNRKYLYSFFVRTRGIKPGLNMGVFPRVGWADNKMRPFPPVFGDRPWHRVEVEFSTPAKLPEKPWIYIWFWGAGEAWVDHVSIKEIP